MMARRKILAILLLGCIGLFCFGLARLFREEENYTLIEEGLYMGGDVKRPPPGTRAVLNLCEKADPYRTRDDRWEPIPDAEPAPDVDWLRQMVLFIDARRREGSTTYVHCRNGVSRSGMVVTAYLMFKHGWTRDQALELIRTKRPIVRPNPAFMKRLLEWEGVLNLKRQSQQ
jgi:hypothetical protein